jgi:DNA adenine methylase|uniref:Site-specific DNA-methyltransferase (adenine-specific) n=1 Tax=candidate division CPR3 bacterium TaxID=2268181 RepID=A0A7V3JAS6_UNCC3
MKQKSVNIVRYPGGKQRLLNLIIPYLPTADSINGRFIDPFLGGGSIFFALNPKKALLSDINEELINLYSGIRLFPSQVWEIYKSFPKTKEAYYQIRKMDVEGANLAFKAARILYLNRTCFKGMWRHNANGQFNVGYGGQDRRWAIDEEVLKEVARRLKKAILKCSDFEPIISSAQEGDFIFLDPPYKPGERELANAHYVYNRFSYNDHKRLATLLAKATERGIKWAMTTSSHPDILRLFSGNFFIPLSKGTGKFPGLLTDNPKEVLIFNYGEDKDETIF